MDDLPFEMLDIYRGLEELFLDSPKKHTMKHLRASNASSAPESEMNVTSVLSLYQQIWKHLFNMWQRAKVQRNRFVDANIMNFFFYQICSFLPRRKLTKTKLFSGVPWLLFIHMVDAIRCYRWDDIDTMNLIKVRDSHIVTIGVIFLGWFCFPHALFSPIFKKLSSETVTSIINRWLPEPIVKRLHFQQPMTRFNNFA